MTNKLPRHRTLGKDKRKPQRALGERIGETSLYGPYRHKRRWRVIVVSADGQREAISFALEDEAKAFVDATTMPGGFLYFVQCGEGGPIKIGVARDVERRLSNLQVGSPTPLRLLAKAWLRDPKVAEDRILKEYAQHYLRGEWFTAQMESVAARLLDVLRGLGCH